MSQALTFIVLGFASGAIYVGISLGLITVYFSSGILNFSQAATAMWSAYVYDYLKTEGKLVFPIGTVRTHHPMATVPAFIIAVATAIVLGVILHLAIFRPLRHRSFVTQIVATVAVLVGIVGLVDVRFGAFAVQVPKMLPTTVWHVGGARLGADNLILFGLAIVSCGLVGAYFRWTTAGVATRAASANENALAMMGYSPHVLDAVAWAIASLSSTTLLILALPSTSLDVGVAFYVVPGLAVLLIARLRSLTAIAVASMVLGSGQALLTLASDKTWWPTWARSGLQEALPFVAAIVVLFAFGERIGGRETVTGGLPKVNPPKRPLLTFAAVVGIGVIGLVATSGPTRFGVITSLVMTVLVLSYTVITGYLGQVSLAQIAFAGASGFFLSKLTSNWGIEFPLSVLLSALFATAIGIIIGVAALRFRGAQLAIVTLAAALAVQAFVFDNAYFTSLTGNPIPPPKLFGANLAVEGGRDTARLPFAIMVLVVLSICVIGFLRWSTGRTGRAWLAVRSNERAAAAAGINVASTKLIGFAVSAFFAGVSGTLIGYSQGQLTTSSFAVDTGILIFATAFLGGITSVGGALIAGAIAPLGVVYVLANDHPIFGLFYSLVAGIGLIVTVMINPEGIAGRIYQLNVWMWNKLTKRQPTGRRAPAELLSGEVGPSRGTG